MKRKNRTAKTFLKTTLFVFFVLLLALFLTNYVFSRTVVDGISMEPTLYGGDSIVIDKLSYNIGKPKRYDVICFKSYSKKDVLIKRIIGMPNETVKIENGIIYINDKELRDINGLEKVEYEGSAKSGITLGNDEYFVIGDNRAESIDSRFSEVGNVSIDDIIGRATFVMFPTSRMGNIK